MSACRLLESPGLDLAQRYSPRIPGRRAVPSDRGERSASGAHRLSEVGNDPYVGTASGSIIGLLVGIIGGPLGVLIGSTYGMLVGSLFDIDDVETTESVLREISDEVHTTRTAVLAQVTEQSLEVIDAAMERLGGDVTRRPAVEVEQEIAAAQEAQRKAEREARKEAAHAKGEELKSKLHRTEARAAA